MADIPFTNPTPSFSESNPAGTGTSLNYIGNHVYAYSGEVSVNNNLTRMLSFTTGSGAYVVAEIIIGSEGASANDFFLESKINDQIVFVTFMSSDTAPYPTVSNPMRILLPPNTRYSLALKNDVSGTRVWTETLVGEIYA